jgi:uncharacterized protein
MKLKLTDDLYLPIEAVTQKFAFLGRTGSGKTYGAQRLAESMLEAHAQVVVLDGIGVWYGLRLKADGKSKGFSIPVFGGEQGDVPLEPQAGKLIAKLIVEEQFSAVLDVSNFRKHERKAFVTDFAEELFHRKKTVRSALHFFCEESQMFIPERGGKDTARMVGAFEDLVKLGRNYGIGASLISQRPQAVNKEVLNQTEILLAFQMTGPHERKAIAGWVADKGMDVNLVDELPSLNVGDAYLWSPQFLRVTKRIHIAQKTTYDASSTPVVGAAIVKPKELSPVDVEKIKASMADVVKRTEESDPRKLKAEIARLQRELNATPSQVAPKEIIKEVPALKNGQLNQVEKTLEKIDGFIQQLSSIKEWLQPALAVIRQPTTRPKLVTPARDNSPRPALTQWAHVPIDGADGLTKAERLVLRAFYWTQNDNNVKPAKIGFYSGYSHKSGGFANTLSSLRSKGLLLGYKITDAGAALASTYAESKPSGLELREWLRPKLSKCENEILDVLIANPGQRMQRETVANLTPSQYSFESGGFANALAKLRSVEAAEGYGQEGIKASDIFFE